MPVPAVYVAAAVVGGVVAVVTFKEFVFDPVIAPKLRAWRDSRQRRLEPPVGARRRPSTPPGSGHPSDSDDDAHDNTLGMSVEMRDLVRTETAEWRNVSEDATLRRRTNRTANVLDESNVFLPFDPISPTAITPSTTAPSSPGHEHIKLRTPPPIHTPLPRHPLRAETLHAAIESQPGPSLPTPRTTPGPSEPRQLYSPSARSDSTQSSFTPAVIGPRSDTAFSDGGRSTTFDIVSPPPRSPMASPQAAAPSPVTSPFAHIHHPLSPSYVVRPPSAETPSLHLLNSPPVSSLNVASESDFAILSPELRSGMFSDTDSDPFDPSDLESEMSAWESVGSRTPARTPSPPSPHS